ncbi:MAG: hypothetical protein ETSY1_43750 [Candidatus Entotheonella factor]|uniref:LysM domain-containing protein n=1 Tax=Entotheonella factor TaxID=1429438 RepID=W4L2U5_ENTF1|nr:MAG: hypothetical protein ETSY1_43750 [Candidatus Entotheonella factor]
MGGPVAAHPASHRMRPGETLWSVAAARGVSPQYLACLNGIRNPNRVRVRQRIILPHRPTGSMRLKLKWPLRTGRLTSRFGPRRRTCHDGIDIAAPLGTPVRAAADGRVVFSGRRRGYGNLVIIQHNQIYRTAYAHLRTRKVRRGQRVRQGKVLATVGRSGRATGPHLHFEVRVRNQARAPIFYLPRVPKRLRQR